MSTRRTVICSRFPSPVEETVYWRGCGREHGVPVQAGRTATLQQLVLQAPAPVSASMLGYHHGHTTRLVREGGGTWNRYAPGDHTQ